MRADAAHINHHTRIHVPQRQRAPRSGGPPRPHRPAAPRSAARVVPSPAVRGFRVPAESGGGVGLPWANALRSAGRSEGNGEAERCVRTEPGRAPRRVRSRHRRSRVATAPFPRLSFTSATTPPPRSGTEPPPRCPALPPPAAPPPLPTSDMAAPPALAVSGAGGGAPPGGPRPGGGFRRSPQQRWCSPRRLRGRRGAAYSSPFPSVSTGSGRRAPPPRAARSRPAPGLGPPGNRRRGPRSSGSGRAAEPAAGRRRGALGCGPQRCGAGAGLPRGGPGPAVRAAATPPPERSGAGRGRALPAGLGAPPRAKPECVGPGKDGAGGGVGRDLSEGARGRSWRHGRRRAFGAGKRRATTGRAGGTRVLGPGGSSPFVEGSRRSRKAQACACRCGDESGIAGCGGAVPKVWLCSG